ncbi:hypothetical protein G6Z26_04530 [Clostridium perfringens]|uniref:hypothetical protein n=1 Tax=Clostridium perfringens TaxID=1502 RepID=UPI0013E3E2FB|nr:hypothetical protein [Clostridium perfringens]NGT31315.1 hypothetical protein [Clostridium perfringens]NGU09035.1 hypothetical protein [Clostridium perfringens]
MDKLRCPRCENEELKGTENYCPICGLNLKEETAQEVPVQEQFEIRIDSNFIAMNLTNRDKV